MAIRSEMPDFFDPMDPSTWVKESTTEPGESIAVAVLGQTQLEE